MNDRKLAENFRKLADLLDARAAVQEAWDARPEKYDTMGLEFMIEKVELTKDINDLYSEMIPDI